MVHLHLNLVKCDAQLNLAKPWLSLGLKLDRPNFQVVSELLIL